MQHDDSGFYSSSPAQGYTVCSDCFDDADIKAFIESAADSQSCDFCERESDSVSIATPLDKVVDFMIPAIERAYERAVNALGSNGAEGGFLGSHWESSELLLDVIGLELPNDDDGHLLDIIANCLGDETWCERDPYALREDEQLIGSWREFCESIKHKRRYFFLQGNTKELTDADEYLTPAALLKFIGKTVRESELIRKLPNNSLIFRARQHKAAEILDSPYDFGPPPVERAIRSNRMSPAGIVMFYGSDDWETAVAEIDDDPQLGISVATFRTNREATILDLTRLPRRLGFFEQEPDSMIVDRYTLSFLHSFVKSIAAKVEPGEREHIDYVPTQVVTEWFRNSFRVAETALDGIWYPSTQRANGKSLVLFADRYDIILNSTQLADLKVAPADLWWVRAQHEKAWLELVHKQSVRKARA